jgi:predicted ribosome quality control (RQC) complex YloA/Tae2 family protein
MLLRNRIVGGQIESIHADGHDRRSALRVRTLEGSFTLLTVLYGAPTGLVLVTDERRILGTSLPTPSIVRDSPGSELVLDTSPTAAPPARADWPTDADDRQTWMRERFEDADDFRQTDEIRQRLRRALARALKSIQRRLTALNRDLDKVDSTDVLRQHADLLSANRHLLRRGLESVSLDNWYLDPPQATAIALDPALSPNENIDRLYHRARRYERGAETVLARMEESAALADSLKGHLAAIESDTMSDSAELQELEAELLRRRWIQPPQRQAGRRTVEERKCYFEFRASSGAAILVGRGSKDNDRLTFQIARGRDLWLHAADVPGSHVILRIEKGSSAQGQAVKEAALLAAHFSKARDEGVVPVRLTERKHIRKPPGANAGQVSLAGGRGIDVRMDDPDLKRLLGQNREASAL